MVPLRALLITAALAAGTAAAQVWLKLVSRTPLDGKRHRLQREDALWWTDWVVAATFAVVGSLLAAAKAGKNVQMSQVVMAVVVLVVGFSVLPFGLRLVAYDKNAELDWVWIFAANGAASLILLSAVVVGVEVYG